MLGIHRTPATVRGRDPASRSRHHSSRRRPMVEPLEERALLSTWTVDNLGDTGKGTNFSGDLRYPITQANQNIGDDTINFSVTGTITLRSRLPDLTDGSGLTDIEGPGATNLTVARSTTPGTPDFMTLVVAFSHVIIAGLTIMNGSPGIHNVAGTLRVTACMVTTNSDAIVNNCGSVTVTDSTIANSSGVGIENYSESTVTVTVALSSNPGGATLGGPLTATAQSGVVTFSGLTLDKKGTGYTVLVTANDLNSATTSAINVTPSAASQLVVTSPPPSSVTAGSSFGLTLTALDPFGNIDTNFNGNVGVALGTNPGAAALGGTLGVAAQNGVATFSDLTLDRPGIGYTLTVSGTGLSSATTIPFDVKTSLAVASMGVGWGTGASATLNTNADGLRLLPDGRNTDVPWLGINKIQITLSEAATLSADDITVLGSPSGISYGPVSVSGSGTSYMITFTAIKAPDRVTITIGNDLIATFTRRLDILPGDVNDDGIVNVQDMLVIRNQMLGWVAPTLFGDINGDGIVDINDYTAVRKQLGKHL